MADAAHQFSLMQARSPYAAAPGRPTGQASTAAPAQSGQVGFGRGARSPLSPDTTRAAKIEAAAFRDLYQARRSLSGLSIGQGAGLLETMARIDEQTARSRAQMKELGATVQQSVNSASSSVWGLAQAGGSLVAWPTFTSSVQLLSITIGQTLLPYLNSMSLALQRASAWFQGLSDSTKEWVGVGLTSVVAFGGIAIAISKIIAAGRMMIGVMQASWAVMASPTGLALGAVAVTVGALAAAWWATRDAAREAGKEMSQAGGSEVAGGPGTGSRRKTISLDEIKQLPEEVRTKFLAAGGDPTKKAKVLEEFEAASQSRLESSQRRAFMSPAEQRERDAQEYDIVRGDLEAAKEEFKKTLRAFAPPPGRGFLPPSGNPATQVRAEDMTATVMAQRAMARMTEAGKAPRDADARQDVEQALATRFRTALTGKKYESLHAEDRIKVAEAQARESESFANLARSLRERAGIGNTPGLSQDLSRLPRAQISDSSAYADRLQIAALNTDDLQSKILQAQLQELKDNKEAVERVETAITRLESRANFPSPYRSK